MAAWAKVALTVLVVLLPGGFLLAVAVAFARLLYVRWREAQAQAPGQGVSLRVLLADVHLRDVVRLARHT
jgi:hypothetical protein